MRVRTNTPPQETPMTNGKETFSLPSFVGSKRGKENKSGKKEKKE